MPAHTRSPRFLPFIAGVLGLFSLTAGVAAAEDGEYFISITDPFRMLEDLDTHPFSRDIILLGGHDSGSGGLYSIHPAAVASGTKTLDDLELSIRRHVLPRVPEGYGGLVVVDHESWYPDPSRGFNHLYPETTRQALAQMDPEVYQKTAVEILTHWLKVFREHRPGVRVAFYGIPAMIYRNPDTEGKTSYAPDVATSARASNDIAQPIIDLQTAVVCVAYSPFVAVFDQPDVMQLQEDRFEHVRAFAEHMVEEGQRLARRGQPVYLMTSARYVRATSGIYQGKYLHPTTLLALKLGAQDADANGLILWASTTVGGNQTRQEQHRAAQMIRFWYRLICRPVFEPVE